MPQLFRPGANSYVWVGIIAVVVLVNGVLGFFWLYERSSWHTRVEMVVEQPVPFSHQHHVGGVGLDCRYCHLSVEKASFAGIPPISVCYNCHAQIWSDAPMLAPVRDAFKNGGTIPWNRVHSLPDFVYFNHSIHVNKGVGCSTCHGRVDHMPLMWKQNTLQMNWCLNCHKNPEKYIRPREKVFQMDWVPPADQIAMGNHLAEEYHIRKNITDCIVCHR